MSDKGLSFSFKYLTRNKIEIQIQNLDRKKACQKSEIPVKFKKTFFQSFLKFTKGVSAIECMNCLTTF